MKRIGNLYDKVCCIENLQLAEKKARRGKAKQSSVILFDRDKDSNLLRLRQTLVDESYTTSRYHIFTLKEKKERIIYSLPFSPDRILHHAVLNITEPIFIRFFTTDTYSCIKKRGIHKCLKNLTKALRGGGVINTA